MPEDTAPSTGSSPRRGTLWSCLELTRPANLVTALADILAGYAVAAAAADPLSSDAATAHSLRWLLLATLGLYGGGVVLNDVFDSKLDASERPERPIPSGRVTRRGATLLGIMLLAGGISVAFLVTYRSGIVALLIAVCAVLYDALGKHHRLAGPLIIGACRGLNLLLGVSAASAMIGERWYLALIPIAYISAITALSTGEVHGGSSGTGRVALILLGGVIAAVLVLAVVMPSFSFLAMLPFLMLFTWRVVPPFWRAYLDPQPAHLRGAVKAGVLSLIVLDSTIAAGYAGLPYGVAVLALLFVAAWLARLFAVT